MAGKIKLNSDEMLQAEFKYITQNAFQANEDRSRFSSYYFVTVGSFVAAILGSPSALNEKTVAFAFLLLFATLTIMGSFTLAQLARLRAAWHEAVQAMNKIKKFYIEQNKEIEPAFKWLKNIPPTDKPNSIANLIATEVALLSSLTAGSGVYFLLTAIGLAGSFNWLIVVLGSFANYVIQMMRYKNLLVDDH